MFVYAAENQQNTWYTGEKLTKIIYKNYRIFEAAGRNTCCLFACTFI